MKIDVVSTQTTREANYAHQGWPASATAMTTPWIASRITRHNQALEQNTEMSTWRRVIQRLAFTIPLHNLSPAPEFEAHVLEALGKPSRMQKFQALNEVFQIW